MVKKWFTELNTNLYFKVDDATRILMKKEFVADYCTEENVLKTIKEVYLRTQQIIDPHTAVGKFIADKHKDPNKIMLIASTAHFSKFPDTVLKALEIDCPEDLEDQMNILRNLKTKTEFHQIFRALIKKPKINASIFFICIP